MKNDTLNTYWKLASESGWTHMSPTEAELVMTYGTEVLKLHPLVALFTLRPVQINGLIQLETTLRMMITIAHQQGIRIEKIETTEEGTTVIVKRNDFTVRYTAKSKTEAIERAIRIAAPDLFEPILIQQNHPQPNHHETRLIHLKQTNPDQYKRTLAALHQAAKRKFNNEQERRHWLQEHYQVNSFTQLPLHTIPQILQQLQT